MYWTGGYQNKDNVISASTTKLKGIALTNSTQLNITIHGGVDGNRIWDVADYVIPPQVMSSDGQYSPFSVVAILSMINHYELMELCLCACLCVCVFLCVCVYLSLLTLTLCSTMFV